MTTSLDVVVGGQFGSEAKGRVAGALAIRHGKIGRPVMGIRVAGPNAGHVVYDEIHRRWAMRQVPVAFVNPDAMLYIAPGSEVDHSVLMDEVYALEQAGFKIRERLLISPEATFLEDKHVAQEQDSDLVKRLGSTAKGIGAARADRIWRTARRVADIAKTMESNGMMIGDHDLNTMFDNDKSHIAVVLEGAQGYGLGLHAGHYPQCTSSDARAIDFLAMAGISPWALKLSGPHDRRFRIHLVIRPNPIRVAGNSGELKGETSWEALGLPEEHTTVTQKVRRVGEFDSEMVRAAVAANGHSHVGLAFSMLDQVIPEVARFSDLRQFNGLSDHDFNAYRIWFDMVEKMTGCDITSLGTSPETTVFV